MGTPQVLSPPAAPHMNHAARKTTSKAPYKRIRFKHWKPDTSYHADSPSQALTGRDDLRDSRAQSSPSAHSSLSDTDTVEQTVSEIEFDAMLRKAIAAHPAGPLVHLPSNGTRMDPFTAFPIKAEGIVPATLDYCALPIPVFSTSNC
jgi:hypothetical protein